MKRAIFSSLLAGALVSTPLTAMAATNRHSVTLYPTVGVVDHFEHDDNKSQSDPACFMVYEDGNGDLWDWYLPDGQEDWEAGDVIAVMRSDNGTPDYIYDDIDLAVRYGGYTFN